MFIQSCTKKLSLMLTGTVFFLTFFYIGCKDSSSESPQSSVNPPGTTRPGDPKQNPDNTLVTVNTAPEVNDENVENFKVSGECVNAIDGGGDVIMEIEASRVATGPCNNGVYTFVVDLTQLTLSNPVIIKISQRINGVTVSESRIVPKGYRTDDPPPENPVVSTSIDLIHPEVSPSDVLSPILRVNNRFSGDTVKLYTNRRCTPLSLVGTTTVPISQLDSEDPEEGTYARFLLDFLTPGKYRFYETSTNHYGTTPCNIGSLEYDLEPSPGAPKSPWLLLTIDPLRFDKSLNGTPTIRIYGVAPGNTVSLHITKHCNDLSIASAVVSDSQSYVELSGDRGLAPGVYLFRARTRNFYGWSRCSLTGTYYTVLKPSPITSVFLSEPTSSPGTDLTPKLTVTNVEPGDTIHLYKSDCTNSLGSAVVEEDEGSVDITVNDGTFTEPGAHKFYARVTGREDSPEFACSDVYADYEIKKPDAPVMTLESGLNVIDTDTTPTIIMSGVQPGDTVHLYKDEDCLRSIGSGVVDTDKTSVEVTSSRLAIDEHTFRSKITQREDALPSECSSDTLTYTIRRP